MLRVVAKRTSYPEYMVSSVTSDDNLSEIINLDPATHGMKQNTFRAFTLAETIKEQQKSKINAIARMPIKRAMQTGIGAGTKKISKIKK